MLRVYRNGPVWSADAGQAHWIAGRLTPWGEHTLTMAVPGGFAAYAQVLHPAEAPDSEDRPVRCSLRGDEQLRAELTLHLNHAVVGLAVM
jgi:hypothetical protein